MVRDFLTRAPDGPAVFREDVDSLELELLEFELDSLELELLLRERERRLHIAKGRGWQRVRRA